MPSPPRPVSASHQAMPAASLASSPSTTSWVAVATSTGAAGSSAAASRARVAICQRWSLSVHGALAGQQVKRRQPQLGQALHRPAVVAIGCQRSRWPWSRARRTSRAAPPHRRRAALASSAASAGPKLAARGGADRRVLVAQQLLGLGAPGHQLAVQQQPVAVQFVPQPGARGGVAHPRQQRLLQRSIVEEAPPGARTRCQCPRRPRRIAAAPRPRRGRPPPPRGCPCASLRRSASRRPARESS